MAHFAEIDSNNKVLCVIVIANEITHKTDGTEDELLGIAFCQFLYGADTKWVQTSYNNNKRGIYSGIGFTYDPVKDIFIAPEPEVASKPTK
jgi:hypothetical protein